MTPIELCVAHARSCVGTKWRHRGRKPWAVDCVGLLVLSVAAGGIVMRDRIDYGRDPWNEGLEREMQSHFGDPVDDIRVGDVVLIRWKGKPAPSHVGIIGDYCHGGLSIIHAHNDFGVAEHRLDEGWRSMIVSAYRPWGDE